MVTQETDPSVTYMHVMKINDQDGTIVLDNDQEYELEFKSKGRMHELAVYSCSREDVFELSSRRKTYMFDPDDEFENVGEHCPLWIRSLEKIKERHSFGVVDFRHPSMKSKAEIKCNARVIDAHSVGICQARESTFNKISFESDMIASSTCSGISGKGKSFVFRMPAGRCVTWFKRLSSDSADFKLLTIGYQQIIYRSL